MKYIKMLGLVAIAAAALMALVGAGTASAKICSTEGAGEACASGHGKVYTSFIDAELTLESSAVLASGFITVSCLFSSANGTLAGGASSPATGLLTQLTFSACRDNISGRECTAATNAASVKGFWPATVTTGTAPNGAMTVTKVTIEFTCSPFGSPVTCRYTASDAGGKGEIVVKGSDTAPEIIATKVALAREEVSGGLCSSTATWSGEYHISTPSSLFLT